MIIGLQAHFKSRGCSCPWTASYRSGSWLGARAAASALRYYERLGLLSPAERAGQRRHYPASSAQRVALIGLYQDAGFTLAEIGRMLAVRTQGRRGWADLAERKIAELDALVADAQRAKRLIEHALECPHRDLLTCPNFRSALEARLERPR